MHLDKSLGPNCMNPTFYQRFWQVVGSDMVKEIIDWYNNCHLPPSINETLITLIPKKNLETMGDLRPIAFCNVVYKIFSKVLANLLKPLLPLVISESQCFS